MSTLQQKVEVLEVGCTSKCSSTQECSSKCGSTCAQENCGTSCDVKDAACNNGSCGSCAPSTNCQDPDSPVMAVDPDKCSGTTNCQVNCDKACTDPNIMVEGACAGQRSRAATAGDLVLMDLAIRDYSFDQVRYRLNDSKVIPAELIETAIDEFRKFLQVIAHAEGSIGMISPVVDEVWHAFILHTPDYMAFCKGTFGEFLHHMPNTPNSPSDSSSVPNFVDGYKALFGELHPIWKMHMASAQENCSNQCNSHCGKCHTCSTCKTG